MQIVDVKELQAGDVVQCITEELNYRLFFKVIEQRGEETLVINTGEISNGRFANTDPDLTNRDSSKRFWPIWLPTKDLQILWRKTA